MSNKDTFKIFCIWSIFTEINTQIDFKVKVRGGLVKGPTIRGTFFEKYEIFTAKMFLVYMIIMSV